MSRNASSSTPVFGEYTRSLREYALIIYIASASISFVVFVAGVFILHKRPKLSKNTMFRTLLLIQMVNSLRFIIRIILTRANISSESMCRILMFLNNGTAELVMYLCVYIIVYLQLTIIHNLSPYKTWPRILLMTGCVLFSYGPHLVILIISQHNAGIDSFCTIPFIPSTRLLHVLIGTIIVWVFAAGIICIVSMLVISIHIFRTSRQTKEFMDRIDRSYGTEGQHRVYTTAALLNRTLRTVVWFPITPIMSLWFNSAMIITRHLTQKAYIPLEFINISLFSLMTIFMAAAFFFNPMVIEFLHDYRKSWSLSRHGYIQSRLRCNPAELTISTPSAFASQPTSKTGT